MDKCPFDGAMTMANCSPDETRKQTETSKTLSSKVKTFEDMGNL
jgi:hypothetical protein